MRGSCLLVAGLVMACGSPTTPTTIDARVDSAVPQPDAAIAAACTTASACPLDQPNCTAAGQCAACETDRPCHAALADTVCGLALGTCQADGQCLAPGAATPIYHYHRASDDLHTYSTAATPPTGFLPEGIAFRVVVPQGETAILHLLHSDQAGDNMTSLDASEASGLGYADAGQLGSIFTVQQGGTYPMRRFVQPSPLRHASALDELGGPDGYSPEGAPQGYVCPP